MLYGAMNFPIKSILDEIENDIIAFAESSPEPRIDELEKYVLADNDPWVHGGGR